MTLEGTENQHILIFLL